MNFGNNLKYLRSINKESQEDIAKLVNKKRTLVSSWENGERTPIVEDLLILSKHYNISIEELYEKNIVLNDVELDETHKLDTLILDKTKTLTEEDKKKIIDIIDIYTK